MNIKINDHQYTLRALEPEDLDFLYIIENDSSFWKFGASNVPYSKYVLRNYIATSNNDIYIDGQVRLIIETELKETIGMVDLVNFDPTHRRAELGIILLEAYRNKGIGQAVIKEICHYANKYLHLNQVYAIVDKNNYSCLQCLQRVGFIKGAVLKQWLFINNDYIDAIILQYIFHEKNIV